MCIRDSINPHKKVGRFIIESPNAKPIANSPADQVQSRWMQISSFEGQPMRPNLSGLPLEYRIIQVYSRDRGLKSSTLAFNFIEESNEKGHLVKEWNFENGTDGWRELNQIKLSTNNGSLHIESTGGDPFMSAKVNHKGGPTFYAFGPSLKLTESVNYFGGPKRFVNQLAEDTLPFHSSRVRKNSTKCHFPMRGNWQE